MCTHSVRIELAKLILVGTRITYQATAGYWHIPVPDTCATGTSCCCCCCCCCCSQPIATMQPVVTGEVPITLWQQFWS